MEQFKAFVATCLSPLVIALVLLLWGWLRYRRDRRSGVAILLLGTLVLLLGSLSIWTFEARRQAEYSIAPLDTTLLPAGPLQVVVLGTGFNPDQYLPANSRVGGAFLARLLEGVRVVRARPDAQLVVSIAGTSPASEKLAFWEAMQQTLAIEQIDSLLVTTAESSLDEAIEVGRVNTGEPVILATSAGHMPRAKMIFEDEGMQVLPAPTDYAFVRAGSARDYFWPRIVPSTGGIGSNHAWLYENVAALWQLIRRNF